MRVILDTNVLISALISPSGPADRVYRGWRSGVFDLVSCEEQIAEIRRVTRRPLLRSLIKPAEAGRLVNQLRHLAVMADPLPEVTASPDPWDNFILAAALGARANFLVTGDKSGLLALGRFSRTRIVTIRQFLREIG
jgi:putative PIN family toxin of toxin-antitoxin system